MFPVTTIYIFLLIFTIIRVLKHFLLSQSFLPPGTALLQCRNRFSYFFGDTLCLDVNYFYLLKSKFHRHVNTFAPHFHDQFFNHKHLFGRKKQGVPKKLLECHGIFSEV